MSFKYLETNITSNRNLKEEVKAKTTKASLLSGYLRDDLRPVMTYATKTRPENTTTKRLLRTTEMRTLRSITGHTLFDRKRNEEIK